MTDRKSALMDCLEQWTYDNGGVLARSEIDDLCNRIAALTEQPNEWMPIESAPRDGTYFIGYWPAALSCQVTETWWQGDSFYHPSGGQSGKIKYWTKLPTPPRTGEKS